MSKKLSSGGFDDYGNPLYRIDTTKMIGNYEICKKVIEQQSTIEEQNKEIEEWEFSFRTEMAHHRIVEKELKEKTREQQTTICKLEERDYYNQSERYKILCRAIELASEYIHRNDLEYYDFCALITEFEKELLDGKKIKGEI